MVVFPSCTQYKEKKKRHNPQILSAKVRFLGQMVHKESPNGCSRLHISGVRLGARYGDKVTAGQRRAVSPSRPLRKNKIFPVVEKEPKAQTPLDGHCRSSN